jgi:hypothetical protein
MSALRVPLMIAPDALLIRRLKASLLAT